MKQKCNCVCYLSKTGHRYQTDAFCFLLKIPLIVHLPLEIGKTDFILKIVILSLVDRFTGQPSAYLSLINYWKLEEVSNYFAFPWDNNSKAL